jgi:hypothetical protein
MSFTKVAIAGVSSEVGKTTLLCDLLREFPGWEAIKMTRGHYRSCGKDPHACCVSHLLGDEPLVRSGFRQTYASDKDTGRYWDAGAANVHWVIVTENQVEKGIRLALERVDVSAPGVFIEGNSFLRFVDVDFAVLVTGADKRIKSSARWAFQKASAVYQFDQTNQPSPSEAVELLNRKFGPLGLKRSLPDYATSDFPRLVEDINRIHSVMPQRGCGLQPKVAASATLGIGKENNSQPHRGCASGSGGMPNAATTALRLQDKSSPFPRIAARGGNPGLKVAAPLGQRE